MADFNLDKKYNYNWQSSKFKDLAFSGSYISQFINDVGYVTSSTAVSASYATSASYAANGGVTQLLAGPNISLSPLNGLGQVTVSATLSGSTIFNTATGSYGSFYDTTTQTNPVTNVPRSMSFNSTDITNGVSISGSTSPFNTYIKTQNAGIYNIQFSAQVDKTDGGTDDVVIWLRKNGIDLTDTATTLTLPTNNSKAVAAWNWFVTSATGDYYQIIWRSLDTDLRLLAEPISATHPGIPSVILTVNRVDQFLSNTGSFSGSFTGSLLGTASYATQALSASYAPSTPAFPYTGSAGITGSLTVVGPTTSTRIGAGAAPSGSIPLDVRAQGALSTDIGLRVRNSTDTYNILAVQGDGNIQIGSDAVGTTRTTTIGATNTSQLVLDTSFSTNTATISVARRISPTYNTNVLLFSQNAFADGNVQPYKFHFVNPSNYWGYTEPGFSMIREAGFMFFKDSATAANLQMKLTPDSVLTMYTASIGAVTIPTEVAITGSAFQFWASGSVGSVKPYFKTQNGTILYLGDQSLLYNVTASSIIASGSITVGTITSTPSTENTLNVYPPLVGGAGEGGQILLAASGGLYTSASMLDNWQNQFRLLKGTNTGGSSAGLVYVDLQSGNTQFVGAVTASAYSGLPNDYLYVTRNTSQTIASGTWADRDIIFNNSVVSKGIVYNTGTGLATLTGGKVYRITARLAWSAAATYLLQYSCYNSSNTILGPTVEIVQSTNASNNISDGTLDFIYAPASNVDVKIRTNNSTSALSGEFIRGDLNTQLIIQQIA